MKIKIKYSAFSVVFIALIAVFFGFIINKQAIAVNEDASFIILPDMQNEPQQVVDAMCDWILENKTDKNIQAVITVGDLTNNALGAEFQRVKTCMNRLNNVDLVNLPIVGNHDYQNASPSTRTTTVFDQYFGPSYFTGKTWYAGNYNNSNANYYVKFDSGTRHFLVLALEIYPRPAVVTWASGIIDQNPDHEVIITTHAYLNPDGTRTIDTDEFGPNYFNLPAADNNGEDLWNNLITSKQNVKLVVSGHYVTGHTAKRSDAGINGNIIHQVFNNWQTDANGGDGWLGLVQLKTASGNADITYVKTYNPPLFSSLPWPAGTASNNQAPIANAGTDQVVILSPINSLNLSGSVSDDGLPSGSTITTNWMQQSGPGIATFADPSLLNTGVSFSDAGTYILKLAASDGSLPGSDLVTVLVQNDPAVWYDENWDFRKIIGIDPNEVSAGLSNFPVLVSTTDADLKSLVNGGNVASDQGFDFVFVDSNNNKLNHEIEKYNPVTGELVAWVKLPNISPSNSTMLQLYFGNSTALDQQNIQAVWDSNYMAAWHLDETTGNHMDSTSNANNSTAVTVSAQGQLGKISGADLFASDQHRIKTSASSATLKKAFAQMSVFAWVKPTANVAGTYGPTIISNTDTDGWALRVAGGLIEADLRLTSGNVTQKYGSQIPVNGWSYIGYVYDGIKINAFVNGVNVGSTNATGTIKTAGNQSTCTFIGTDPSGCLIQSGAEFPFRGTIDEVRVSDNARSAAWIATEYNNQADPSGFAILSSMQVKP